MVMCVVEVGLMEVKHARFAGMVLSVPFAMVMVPRRQSHQLSTDTPLGTAEEFWIALSKGATVRDIQTKNGPGKIAEFSDKSHVVWRPVTTSSTKTGDDHPAVELDVRTSGHGFPPRYKIHFRKGSKR